MMRFWRDRSIRFRPDRRRPDDWADAHDRARSLAAERLSEPLGPGEAAWLVEHLAACAPCQEAATAYERQRDALRSLGLPDPPRDLWARTAAALDREAATGVGRRGSSTSSSAGSTRWSAFGRVVPYGALAGVLVVAVVVGASILARRTPPLVPASPEPSVPASLPLATPITFPIGPIAWLERREDGTYALAVASVDQVCPGSTGSDCPPITSPREVAIALSGDPRVVVRSPTSDRLVVVVSGETGGRVLVVPVPSPTPAPAATPTPAPAATPTPTPTATASPTATATATSTPAPPPSPTPTQSPTPTPTQSPQPSPPGRTGAPSPSPASSPTVAPSESPASAPSPSESAPPSPSTEPTPSASADSLEPVAILDGVSIVGQTAAWSPSGRWFAFTARPGTGLEGPNVYVWTPGEAQARPLTTDGRSVFSAWLGDWIVGSRIEDRSDAGAPDVVLGTGRPFLLDPATGQEQPLETLDMWRPVVDPTGHWVVYWSGSLRLSDDGSAWLPDAGALVLGPWSGGLPPTAFAPEASPEATPPAEERTAVANSSAAADRAAETIRGRRSAEPEEQAVPSPSPAASAPASPSPTGRPSPTGSPSPSPSSSPAAASPSPSVLDLPEGVTALVPAPVRDWDVRWDPTGLRFAIWVADPVDPSVGRLSLFTIDPQTGAIDPEGVTLRDEPALAGFALGLGRLAWAVPPGQGGEPSHVRVLAWSGSDVGTAVSQPGPGTMPVIVVR